MRRNTGSRALAGRPPTFHSVAEAAEILRMSEMTLYRAIAAGEFPAVRVRGRLIVPARAIDDMVESALAGYREVDAAEWAAGDSPDAQKQESPGGIAARRGDAPVGPGDDRSMRSHGSRRWAR